MEILDLMVDPQARLICVSDSGAEIAATPAELADWAGPTLRPEEPLNVFASESQGNVVSAFLAAIVKGHATETAVLADTGETCRVDAFDRRETFGCVLVVASPTKATFVVDRPAPVRVPVRRCTSGMDGAGRTLWIDDDYERMLGYSAEDVVGRSTATTVHPDDMERTIVSFADSLQRPNSETRLRMRVQHKEGRWMWIEVTRTNLLHTSDPHILTETLDVSAEMAVHLELEKREALLARLTEALPIGVLHIDADGSEEFTNDRWTEMTGAAPGQNFEATIAAAFEEPDLLLSKLRTAARAGQDLSAVVRYDSELGPRQGRLQQQIVRTEGDAQATGLLLTLDDITESLTFQQELSKQARTDHLTSSLNRLGIEEQISALLAETTDFEIPIHLLYFDLDDFKAVNDVLGHNAGDAVLQETVQCIRYAVRPHDLVGRVGGDEFVVVLRGIDAEQVGRIAGRIQLQLEDLVGVSASVGLTTACDGDDFESLVRRADKAMYLNKRERGTPLSTPWTPEA